MRNYARLITYGFSPLHQGLVGVGGMGFGLLLYQGVPSITEYTPPLWAWLVALLAILGGGLILHVTVQRVVFIKLYVTAIYAIVALTHGHLVWSAVTSGAGLFLQLIIAILTAVISIAIAIQTYTMILKVPERTTMPQEDFGVLDSTSGLVNPSVLPPEVQKQHRQWDKTAAITRSLLPLTAGLSMFLVRSLPASGDLILGMLCAMFMTVVFAAAAGRNLGFAVASRRWEEQHGMAIIVKRP